MATGIAIASLSTAKPPSRINEESVSSGGNRYIESPLADARGSVIVECNVGELNRIWRAFCTPVARRALKGVHAMAFPRRVPP